MIDPQVSLPLSELNALKARIEDLERTKQLDKQYTEEARKRAENKYGAVRTFAEWVEVVLTETCYLCQEWVPLESNSSVLALSYLSSKMFERGNREDWDKLLAFLKDTKWSGEYL